LNFETTWKKGRGEIAWGKIHVENRECHGKMGWETTETQAKRSCNSIHNTDWGRGRVGWGPYLESVVQNKKHSKIIPRSSVKCSDGWGITLEKRHGSREEEVASVRNTQSVSQVCAGGAAGWGGGISEKREVGVGRGRDSVNGGKSSGANRVV